MRGYPHVNGSGTDFLAACEGDAALWLVVQCPGAAEEQEQQQQQQQQQQQEEEEDERKGAAQTPNGSAWFPPVQIDMAVSSKCLLLQDSWKPPPDAARGAAAQSHLSGARFAIVSSACARALLDPLNTLRSHD
jgi:hypothetical protein